MMPRVHEALHTLFTCNNVSNVNTIVLFPHIIYIRRSQHTNSNDTSPLCCPSVNVSTEEGFWIFRCCLMRMAFIITTEGSFAGFSLERSLMESSLRQAWSGHRGIYILLWEEHLATLSHYCSAFPVVPSSLSVSSVAPVIFTMKRKLILFPFYTCVAEGSDEGVFKGELRHVFSKAALKVFIFLNLFLFIVTFLSILIFFLL